MRRRLSGLAGRASAVLAVLAALGPILVAAQAPGLGNRVVCYAADWARVSAVNRPNSWLPAAAEVAPSRLPPAREAAAARLLEAHRRLLPCLQYRNNGGACAWTPAELDASLCTHVIYSFSSLTDHTISGGPTVLFFDPAAATALLPEFRALKGPTRNPNIKLLLAIGGW